MSELATTDIDWSRWKPDECLIYDTNGRSYKQLSDPTGSGLQIWPPGLNKETLPRIENSFWRAHLKTEYSWNKEWEMVLRIARRRDAFGEDEILSVHSPASIKGGYIRCYKVGPGTRYTTDCTEVKTLKVFSHPDLGDQIHGRNVYHHNTMCRKDRLLRVIVYIMQNNIIEKDKISGHEWVEIIVNGRKYLFRQQLHLGYNVGTGANKVEWWLPKLVKTPDQTAYTRIIP